MQHKQKTRIQKIAFLKGLASGRVSINDVRPQRHEIWFHDLNNDLYSIGHGANRINLSAKEFADYGRSLTSNTNVIIFEECKYCEPMKEP